MKFSKLLFLTACLLITGCKDNTQSNNTGDDNNTSESGENQNSKPLDPSITSSKWGVEAATVCYETLGAVIPFMEADAFEIEETEDNFGDAAIWFYLYYATEEIAASKLETYAWAAYEQQGYECVIGPQTFQDPTSYSTWEQNVLVADKVISNYKAIEIMALDSIREYKGEGKPCLGLYCFNYIPNPTPEKFPKYAVFDCIGTSDVPNFDNVEGSFTHEFFFDIQSGMKVLTVGVKSTTHSIDMEELYFYMLLDKGYEIAQFDDLTQEYADTNFKKGDEYPGYEQNYSYLAHVKNSNFMIEFYYSLDYMMFVMNFIPVY